MKSYIFKFITSFEFFMHNGIKIIKKAVEGQQKKSEWKIMKINKSKGLDGTVSMVDFSFYGLS